MMSLLKNLNSEQLRSKVWCRRVDDSLRFLSTTTTTTTTTTADECSSRQKFLVDSTRMWFQKVVLGQKLCPFARLSATRIVASLAESKAMALLEVRNEVDELMLEDRTTTHETTLLVFDNMKFSKRLLSFGDFLSDAHETVVVPEGYEDDVQLVLFHPLFRHILVPGDDESKNNENAADFSMRSPFPTIHLLREVDLSKTTESGSNLDELPKRNEERLLSLGLEYCKAMLNECYHPPDK
jgi:hypothetical protein